MSRPRKVRVVKGVPEYKCFLPARNEGRCNNECAKNKCIVKVEEYEAMRLRDIEDLNQSEAAKAMHISRQTYQRILAEARVKVTKALMEGKAICISGGDYKVSNAKHHCPCCNRKVKNCKFKCEKDV